ncbi:MAG: radical SAM protein [Thermoplasmata archaeon]|nr:MAG: radical SAM protein [Thermoplasmata archaeon]
MGNASITSFYIGGGTPTTMVGSGLEEIVEAVKQSFSLKCGISMETHPNDIAPSMIEKLKDMGVESVSMGVESFNDRFLEIIGRTYRSRKARDAVSLLMESEFKCVNIDLMFGLPDQEIKDVEEDIKAAIELGVDQISAYPIFTFPHTKLEEVVKRNGYSLPGIIKRRMMLKKIEEMCYDAGMERTSVWAFTKKGVKKYSSVTVPRYIGLGAGAGSLIPNFFFINTFSVEEYIKFIESKSRPPVALSIKFSEEEEMLHWLYWRIYETKIIKRDFEEQFGRDFDSTFKKIFFLFEVMGMARDEGDKIIMTDRGNYWVHVLQNVFSLDFIGRVWDVCLSEKWPGEIELI